MALLQPKVPFWVCPCVRWNPYSCSVWWLGMATKKGTIFPKQIVATKMRAFFSVWTQIVFAYFLKNDIFTKKKHFSSQPPKKHYFFWFFFEIFLFHFFHIVPFTCSNIKKTKTKSAHFFSKTLFWHPDKLLKKYFRTPTRYLCSFRPAKNTIKLGKNKQKKILDGFSTQPWTDFQLKNPQILDGFSTLQHIHIYIYRYTHVHTGCCLGKTATKKSLPKILQWEHHFWKKWHSLCRKFQKMHFFSRSRTSKIRKHYVLGDFRQFLEQQLSKFMRSCPKTL